MKTKPIYVEINIEAPMEELWEATQTPSLHEQWDVRFSSINYLPKIDNEPQLFEYKTNIIPGYSIAGWGKSVGSFHAKDHSRTSSLHFGTTQRLSPIREGKGYWKYIPKEDSIQFLTQYDYQSNFGAFGRLVDKYLFRPGMGWGTALSFDVLKRWLEKKESPRAQYTRFFLYWMITILFFIIWVYQGLIPKIVWTHPEELRMLTALSPFSMGTSMLHTIGALEILFGLVWLFYRRKKKLFGLQLILFPLLTLSAILADPGILTHPFNPFTFNLALFILSIAGFWISNDIPTAKSCKRTR